MARVVVDVMLKPEILDPQGQAIAGALPSLEIAGVRGVRQGKHFEIDVDGDPPSAAAMESVRRMAETLLANPVIEDFAIRVEDHRTG
ncbi:MAG: phosphoribosylformylglycinamidine synthase subunit PurS [Actinomycetota bacterium]|nr:phosphoribosylformylglycinamidine synthase subunit PurS [Actinomycetota bacterium]